MCIENFNAFQLIEKAKNITPVLFGKVKYQSLFVMLYS
jgi:hypothetical protein